MQGRWNVEVLTAVVVSTADATRSGATSSAATSRGIQSQVSLSEVTRVCTQAVTVVKPLHQRPVTQQHCVSLFS